MEKESRCLECGHMKCRRGTVGHGGCARGGWAAWKPLEKRKDPGLALN